MANTRKKTTRKKPTPVVATQEVDRTPRAEDAEEYRPSDDWTPASVLPLPDPRDGFVFRWIRTSSYDKIDNKNVSQKFREGWVPCTPEDHPELGHVMTDVDSRFEGNIEVGGLLLCKNTIEKVAQRREYYENLAASQMKAVDEHFLKENDPRMPLLAPSRKTRTQFGGG
jgi:hypothetical protein